MKTYIIAALAAGSCTLTILSPCQAQIGTRTVTQQVDVPKAYDSSADFKDIDCNTDKKSLIGLELYVSPGGSQDWYDGFLAEEGTGFDGLLNDEQRSILKNPAFGTGWEIKDGSEPRGSHFYPQKPNYYTHVYQPALKENKSSRLLWVFTKGDALENRSFRIIDCHDTVLSQYPRKTCIIFFTLQDEQNHRFSFKAHSNRLDDYPFHITARLEHLKKQYTGQSFYRRTDLPGAHWLINAFNKEEFKYIPEKEYKCTDVTFLKGNTVGTNVYLVFKDNEGKEYAIAPEESKIYSQNTPTIHEFWDEAGYAAYKVRKKKAEDSLLALEKAAANEKLAEEKEEKEHFNALVAKYGKKTATMIKEGHLELGMTIPMCREAWGEPYSTTKTKTAIGIMETWRYGYGSRLIFTNGKLTSITQ